MPFIKLEAKLQGCDVQTVIPFYFCFLISL